MLHANTGNVLSVMFFTCYIVGPVVYKQSSPKQRTTSSMVSNVAAKLQCASINTADFQCCVSLCTAVMCTLNWLMLCELALYNDVLL